MLHSPSGRTKGIIIREAIHEEDSGDDAASMDSFRVHDLNAPMHMVLIDLRGQITQVTVRCTPILGNDALPRPPLAHGCAVPASL